MSSGWRGKSMKRAVGVSLGSSSRDHRLEMELLGESITVERIGTDGDVSRAVQLYEDLDGKVDALGVGGAVLSIDTLDRSYDLSAVRRMIRNVRSTPVVDGTGFKSIMERRIVQHLEREIGDQIWPKRGMVTSGVDRFGLALSFDEAGYDMVYADLMFILGLPIPLRSLKSLTRATHILGPIVRHLPMSFLYPTGQREEVTVPKYEKWYHWAQVIGGDCNYIRRHMPTGVEGKVVVTNTTTQSDVAFFRDRGIRYLATSTPRLEGRTFGTNVMEAVIVALAGKGRPLAREEMEDYIGRLSLQPEIEQLNP
jgi:hypothetical protein